MQFNRDASGKLTPLPKPSVDTGAGLERVAQVLGGFRNNYETDLFTPILKRAQELSGVPLGRGAESDVSLKVVADHARAVTFMIGDGVLPANEGRGYVLRRILRRAARHGVLLGLDRPFLFEVANAVIDEMGRAFPELTERRAFITSRVRREEERFLTTLRSGLALLNDEVATVKAKGGTTLPGAVVFRLYDTFGFPVDLTQDVLRSHALAVDESGFRAEMELQRARSRESWRGSGDAGVAQIYSRIAADVATEFTGYEALTGESRLRALLVNGAPVEAASEGAEVEIAVDETPFYAESGGQVGDRGVIESDTARVEIADTQRPSGALVMHRGRVVRGTLRAGDAVRLAVDPEARAATVRNHSGTHLLHAALRRVIGPQAMQKGSLVSPERLRFDFTHDAPLTDAEIERIEDLVNAWIEANDSGSVRQMGYKAAIAAGAVALFEEKYGDEVRVVSFGGVSTELCGGTHARATGDIGLLKVLGESGIAAGVRRIEALTGLGAFAHLRAQEKKLRRVSDLLRVPSDQASERIEKLLDERKAAEKQIAELKRAQFSGGTQAAAQTREIGGVQVLVRRADGLGAGDLRGLVDDLRGQLKSGVVLVASGEEGKVALALGVSPDLKDRLKAGDLVREISALVGGKGGGRPDFAQGGGTDASKLDAAIERLYALIGEARA
jgi:alanyl-tRNA synthetase